MEVTIEYLTEENTNTTYLCPDWVTDNSHNLKVVYGD